jgi:hypothetical protein
MTLARHARNGFTNGKSCRSGHQPTPTAQFRSATTGRLGYAAAPAIMRRHRG